MNISIDSLKEKEITKFRTRKTYLLMEFFGKKGLTPKEYGELIANKHHRK